MYNPPSNGKAVPVINERQQAMLEFERTFWTFDEPKETLIRARFQCSADEYYAELNELLEQPEALDTRSAGRPSAAAPTRFAGVANGSTPAPMRREAHTHERPG